MARITLKTVSEHAGVGTATAERVLNDRGGVSPALAARVLASARKLGYRKSLPMPHRGVVRVEVLMTRPELSFITRLSKSFERIAASLDTSIAIHRTFMDESDPQAISQRIAQGQLRRSALIFTLPDDPAIRAALLVEQQKGLPLVQLVSPLGSIDANYVGIDNRAAGRMAGLLMAGMQRRQGTVVGFCHSQIYAVHRDRMRGFSEFMGRAEAAHLQFRQTSFTHDNGEEAAKIAAGLIKSIPDLVGIYSAGGDYGPLCDVIRRHRKQKDICVIGHELTDQTAAALRDGSMAAVIDQAPETQARRALDLVFHKLGLLDQPVDPTPIRFITVTAENL